MIEEPFTFSLPKNDNTTVEQQILALQQQQQLSSSQQEGGGIQVDADGGVIGDGCYVSCTVHRKRYYGILVDQNALTAASALYFKNEADSLDLNRRMRRLYNQQESQQQRDVVAEEEQQLQGGKRQRVIVEDNNNNNSIMTTTNTTIDIDNDLNAATTTEAAAISFSSKKHQLTSKADEGNNSASYNDTEVQKYMFLPPNRDTNNSNTTRSGPGYRTLLATYANVHAAAEEDDTKTKLILKACKEGGNFVGRYYYQFQVRKWWIYYCLYYSNPTLQLISQSIFLIGCAIVY
jgi:hypothetical protein